MLKFSKDLNLTCPWLIKANFWWKTVWISSWLMCRQLRKRSSVASEISPATIWTIWSSYMAPWFALEMCSRESWASASNASLVQIRSSVRPTSLSIIGFRRRWLAKIWSKRSRTHFSKLPKMLCKVVRIGTEMEGIDSSRMLMADNHSKVKGVEIGSRSLLIKISKKWPNVAANTLCRSTQVVKGRLRNFRTIKKSKFKRPSKLWVQERFRALSVSSCRTRW